MGMRARRMQTRFAEYIIQDFKTAASISGEGRVYQFPNGYGAIVSPYVATRGHHDGFALMAEWDVEVLRFDKRGYRATTGESSSNVTWSGVLRLLAEIKERK